MSSLSFNLHAWWGPRPESAAACAEHFAGMLTALASLHPAFARWNKGGETRAAANRPFWAMPPRLDELTRIFEKHPFTRGRPKDGYSFVAWNGQDSCYGARLRMFVGGEFGAGRFRNNIGIHLNRAEPRNADLINAAVMKRALLAVVAAWQPDWAGIEPSAYWERWAPLEHIPLENGGTLLKHGHLTLVWGCWMTYLCADFARRITPPPGISVEQVAGGGVLLVATEETFTPGNPAHDAAADAIQNALLPLDERPKDDNG